MKKIVYNIFFCFHIGIIICVSLFSSYVVHCEYHQIPKKSAFFNFFGDCIRNTPMRYYMRYSGTETGYGFFAPNVRSSGVIISEINGKKNRPHFKSFEGQIRYSGLAGDILDDIFTKKNPDDNSLETYTETKRKYYDLLFKNITVKLINESQYQVDTAIICYNLITYPSLKEIKSGKEIKASLYKLKELKFSIAK